MKTIKTSRNLTNLLVFFLLLLFNIAKAQTIVYSDNMESSGWTWKGIPKILLNSYYTGGNSGINNFPNNSDYFSSSDSCFALFGTGLGSSAIERDTLSYLNVTGLDPNGYYQFRFKIASFSLNPTINTAAGVDNSDFVQIDYSSNGGLTYFKELKFTGNNNSRWSFNGGIQIAKVANGTLTTFTFSGTPTTTLAINLPLGITQFAANIIMVLNATGETWMIDDVELVKVTALPIELLYFDGIVKNKKVLLKWSTASEINNDYFIIYRAKENFEFEEIARINGNGNSNFIINYEFIDENLQNGIYYYKLAQVDFDGTYKEFDPLSVKIKYQEKQLLKIYNLNGQEVDINFNGPKILIYDDGQRIIKIE